jgi:hypothetical protein
MERTPEVIVVEYLARGRKLEQIKAVAVARGEDKLRQYVEGCIAGTIEIPTAATIAAKRAAMVKSEPVAEEAEEAPESVPVTQPTECTVVKSEAPVAPVKAAEKAPKAPPKPKTERTGMTALEAAEAVLRENGRPMTAEEIVALMLSSGKWTTNGKTPDRTISVSLIRDIQKNGDKSKFRKADEKKFAVA